MTVTTVDMQNATIGRLEADLASGALSAVDLMAAVLDRAHRTESDIHAYAFLDEAAALASAERADALRAEGAQLGPLHGIPFGVKDLYSTADMPTAAGSRILAGNWPEQDAAAVAALRAAGAIVVGKQHTHEFGFGLDEPPTRNAWDTERYPGGSTAGGAVSVAVGSCVFALGTDGGGSIRKPASLNGCVGLKPSLGAISTEGIVPGRTSADHVGWITRGVDDAAILWSTFSGVQAPPRQAGLAGVRVGLPSFFFRDVEPAIQMRVGDALAALREAGAVLVEVDIPELDDASSVHSTIVSAESYGLHKSWVELHPGLYHPANLQALREAATITDSRLAAARDRRSDIRAAIDEAFDRLRLDAMSGPTVALQAVRMVDMDPRELLPHYTRLTIPFNLTGQPAISIPCGLDNDGLPVGLQIAARTGAEDTVIRLARTVEESTLWQPHGALGKTSAPPNATSAKS